MIAGKGQPLMSEADFGRLYDTYVEIVAKDEHEEQNAISISVCTRRAETSYPRTDALKNRASISPHLGWAG